MKAPRQFEVGVLGAGPAGASLAVALARLGYRVALFHRARPPRISAVWETVSPGGLELLQRHHPEYWPRLERHLVRSAATVRWSRSDFADPPIRPATLIDRRELDPLLRESASTAGAILFAGGDVASRIGKFWRVTTDQSVSIDCQFLVDAAGRHSGLPGKRTIYPPRTFALTARVDGTNLDQAETRIEALAEAWFWTARGIEPTASVTLFVGLETMRLRSEQERKREFLRLLEPSSLSVPARKLSLASRVAAVDATIAERQPVCEDQLLRIGDAALALDPLASQGIHHALLTARYAAAAINTTMTKGDANLAAEFIRARHADALQHHLSTCRALYRRQDMFDTAFWRERAGAETYVPPVQPGADFSLSGIDVLHASVALCPLAQWKTLPVLEGDSITRGRVLFHPNLSRPCAFLENQPLSELLGNFFPGITGQALVQQWIERGLTVTAASQTLAFLLRHRILQPDSRDALRSGAAA